MVRYTIIRVLSLLIALGGFAGNAHAIVHEFAVNPATEHAVAADAHSHDHPDSLAPATDKTSLDTDCCQPTVCSAASAVLHTTSLAFARTTDHVALSGTKATTDLRYAPPIRPPR